MNIPFFFADQVLEDFKYMFKDIDHEALTNKWKTIEKKPYDEFRVNLDIRTAAFHRDDTLHNFLTFLKLLPVHKHSFERAVKGLFVFSDDAEIDTQTLINPSAYPHIICVYSKAEKQFRFHIVVSKSLMNVSYYIMLFKYT